MIAKPVDRETLTLENDDKSLRHDSRPVGRGIDQLEQGLELPITPNSARRVIS